MSHAPESQNVPTNPELSETLEVLRGWLPEDVEVLYRTAYFGRKIGYFAVRRNGRYALVQEDHFGYTSVSMPLKPSREHGSAALIHSEHEDGTFTEETFLKALETALRERHFSLILKAVVANYADPDFDTKYSTL